MSDQARFEAMAAFLADPATHGGAPVARIDTHTAAVILAGDRAFKLRRPVDYGWLDYASHARRLAAAERELADNRAGAPGLYLGLGGITGAEGRWRLHPPGTAPADAEPVVVMHRFAQEDVFDAMAACGRLDAALMHATGQAVAQMHRAAPRSGEMAHLPAFARAEVNDLTALAGVLDGDLIERLAPLIRARAGALEPRAAARHAHRCHGDLHLRNIVLWQGRPAPFDCIDFNPAFTDIDPLYDLAFLLMDLDHRGLPDLASACFNAWQERLSAAPEARLDLAFGGLALMGFYKACRAAIRGKVMGMALAGAGRDGADPAQRAEADSYLRLALAYLETPPAPRLIAIGGLSGAGKSTLARHLAAALSRVDAPAVLVLRSDAIRKGLFGVAETARLGAEAYRPEVSDQVYAALEARAGPGLADGLTVILDAAHLRAPERAAAEALARRHGAAFQGLWLDAPVETLTARVTARRGDVSDADAAVVARQTGYGLGRIDWPRLAAGGDAAGLAKRALALIENPG